MNHDDAHGLRVQLATALKERDEWHHVAEEAIAAHSRIVADQKRLIAADNATLAERDALRGVIGNLLNVMEMQEKRESGAFHITGEVMWGIWSDAKSQARAALAGGGDRG